MMHLLATVALMSALPWTLAAQDAAGTTLVIQQDGREVGRETFTLRQGRNRGVAGTTLTSSVRYSAAKPTIKLGTTLERTPEFVLAMFQMDVDSSGDTTNVYAVGAGARLILRTLAKRRGGETGRELPGGTDVVLLDDAVFALYLQVADLATPTGRALTAVFPRTGRRAAFTARREAAAGGTRVTLSGGVTGTLQLDADGNLVKVELPATHTVVTRHVGRP